MTAPRVLALLHPVLLALSWTLSTYLATGTPAWALLRPAAVVMIIALAIQVALSVTVRSRPTAALLASIIVLGFAAAWTVALPLAAVVAWWLLVNRVRAARGRPRVEVRFLDQFSRGVGFVAIVLVVLLGSQTALTLDPQTSRMAVIEPEPGPLPDIYMVLLDGYPRADVLESRFGIDIAPFIEELALRGFDVHEQSRSNYTSTWATLASMFQAAYLEDIPSLQSVPTAGPEQYRALGHLVNDSPLVRMLQQHGYRIAASPPPYSELALRQADQLMDTIGPSWFEEQLLEKSLAATAINLAFPDLFAGMQRDRVDGGLDRFGHAGNHGAQPLFFFDHILSPHPPFVFTTSGGQRELQACFPGECSLWAPTLARLQLTKADYAEAMAGQIEYLNSRLLESIDALLQSRPDAVIVLFGDHATRYDVHADPDEATLAFIATRTPTAPGLYGDDISTVNLLSGLLNRYLGSELPRHAFKAWLSIGDSPLPLRPLP